MTPEKQRIAIAEWCGAVWYRHPVSRIDNRVYKFLAWPGVQEYEGQSEQWKVKSDGTERMCSMDYMAREFFIPDYLNDLNAMHEAESKLNESQKAYFCAWLGEHVTNDNPELKRRSFAACKFRYIHATASQRAEALLRAIGKWTDDKGENK